MSADPSIVTPDPADLPAGESPWPEDRPARRPPLGLVDRRRRAARTARRQVAVLRTLSLLFVVGALGVTAAAHTLVASDQQRIDGLQSELSASLATQQQLRLTRAQLESPVRVLSIAQKDLGMVAPGSVTYLAPVDPGPSVEQAQAAAVHAGEVSGGQGTPRGGTGHGPGRISGSRTG